MMDDRLCNLNALIEQNVRTCAKAGFRLTYSHRHLVVLAKTGDTTADQAMVQGYGSHGVGIMWTKVDETVKAMPGFEDAPVVLA